LLLTAPGCFAVGVLPTPDLITSATGACVDGLRPYVGEDWRSTTAADLSWSCWDTALHVADDLYFYALQLIQGSLERRYLPTELALDEVASVSGLLEAIPVHGELLRRAVLCAGPSDRGYHVYGISDRESFAAMGAVETLIHTYDIVRGLNPDSRWRPPAELAAPILERLYPAAPEGDACEVLLYCRGRAPLGERPRQEDWRWDGQVRT
jgi:hypothetical protein